MTYTGADVRREAEAYREWSRQRDKEQFHNVIRARLLAYDEMRNHDPAATPSWKGRTGHDDQSVRSSC